ncbi:hemin uptake protein HemP [Ancylobacter sp. 6x-1]|uniref:Hemin uptake protein HemP n=1 Tax=Ancylobacter crimeensis TaxID=2579147 RepID=A0ABT0D6G0_9HYPH|nr:hemin uptake protein HemP [Ancylobacter crimeensis]MCK0195536.1 hemin uptake protein HemP [Ancylobacter crimeensis]
MEVFEMSDGQQSRGVADTVPGSRRVIPVVDQTIDSRELFIATKEIIIAHRGESYRLRLTSQNKLILTK